MIRMLGRWCRVCAGEHPEPVVLHQACKGVKEAQSCPLIFLTDAECVVLLA